MKSNARVKWNKYSEEEKEELINKYAPLVDFLARRIAIKLPPNIDVQDLVNSGIIGLIDAVDKFDPDRMVDFKTYAQYRVRGAILDSLRALDWVPRSVREKSSALGDVIHALEGELGRAATEEEIAQALGVDIHEFHQLLYRIKGADLLSFEDFQLSDESSSKLSLEAVLLSDEDDALDKLETRDLYDLLARGIDQLPQKERLVITLYYYEELTMKEIGKILDLTESRVSQLHAQAVLRIQGRLKKEVLG
ncbi:MAG: FliA/WhiG family RNA polymerase sigma factor [Candidatus Methylomirabilis sp.]|nr:FliA/WhiG family RNA polymerase sigma factor [Deltaproteobacteria bacterium]